MFHLLIATPEKVFFDDEVISVTVPGTVGYFQVLQNHAPIIASLKMGKITVVDKNNKTFVWATHGGFFENSHNDAALLADDIIDAHEIVETHSII